MPPKKAVENLLAMDDQDIIRTYSAREAIAKRKGEELLRRLLVLPDAPRAGGRESRKMANRPVSLSLK
jgi:hypothetical protein